MKYTIMHVNDRAKKNMDHNKKILNSFELVEGIEYVNGNECNGWDILNHRGIPLSVWKPYDGRSFDPLPGEYGIWISTMNLWKFIVDNKIDELLVLEDDIILQDDFVEKLKLCRDELPEDYDFLSLYYFDEQNGVDENTDIGLEYIHKSNNQYAAAQAMLYSLKGAKTLLKCFKRKGMEYTNDCFIYKQSQVGWAKGYSIKMEKDYFLKHDNKKIESVIDKSNARNT